MTRRVENGFGAQVLDKTAEIGSNLKDVGQIVKDAVDEKFRETFQKVADVGAKGSEKVQEIRDEIKGYVETRPLKSVLLAVGAGFLIGAYFRRR